MTRRLFYPRDAARTERMVRTVRQLRSERASTGGRGYGPAHKRERVKWKPLVDRGEVPCARCQKAIPPAGEGRCPKCGKNHHGWDLGHNDQDRTVYSGPEHQCCNRGAPRRSESRRG